MFEPKGAGLTEVDAATTMRGDHNVLSQVGKTTILESTMQQFNLVVDRIRSFPTSILGELFADGRRLCYTLELPWRWNQRSVSCVPPGIYNTFLRYDKKDNWRIQLTGVPGRSAIQIHIGNYPSDIEGCVLVGTSYGVNAVYNSRDAYQLLKTAFYGTPNPVSCPDKRITVQFKGVLATPWGDYPQRPGHVIA